MCENNSVLAGFLVSLNWHHIKGNRRRVQFVKFRVYLYLMLFKAGGYSTGTTDS